MSALTDVLAAAPTGEGAKAGPWGLAVILLLCVACYFLFKSMSKHLRKVREEFPSDDLAPVAEDAPSLVKPDGAADAAQPDDSPAAPAPEDRSGKAE